MIKGQKILFLGHDATRTGAPLLLLELIKWLKKHSDIEPALLLKRAGEIESDYQAIAPTFCLAREYQKLNGGLHRRALRRLGLAQIRQPDLAKRYPVSEFPVVYANTIDTCDLILRLAGPGRRIIHHVHELSYATNYFGAEEMMRRAVPVTDSYIVVSGAVREYLEKSIGVPRAKIQVVHGFPLALANGGSSKQARPTVREQLNIPQDAFVVGMCGLPQWRKGTDLFVQLALHVSRHSPAVSCHFVWLGGDAESHREALYDSARTGLQNVCHFIPAVTDPERYFSALDLFALTSREDPFSVAMLEAAVIGLPIVCFADAGGAPELVESDAGIIVPYLDVPAMAQACIQLFADRSRCRQLGENARRKVQERYLLSLQGPKILAVIEAAMADGGLGTVAAGWRG